ncbi:MAG: hypothetical protein HAW67_07030, partial [Endozoicomonadaceae bacterium]|nr:hypothetical protein [Endozoicomonadaceae bacterium]
MSKQNMKWIDLSSYGLHLIPTKLPSGTSVIVLAGEIDSTEQAQGSAELGFAKASSYIRYATKYNAGDGKIVGLKPSDFLKVWPDMKLRLMSHDEVFRPWTTLDSNKTIDPVSTPVSSSKIKSINSNDSNSASSIKKPSLQSDLSLIKQARFLGKNSFGESVLEGIDGRFIAFDDRIVTNSRLINDEPARFLKSIDLVQFNSIQKI